jgi:hypothetical protein
MRCDEIQERFVDLLYQEQETPSAGPEVQEHIRSCDACRKELAGLKDLQAVLKSWQDEQPLQPVTIPQAAPTRARIRIPFWGAARFAAIAALIALAFLGLSNAEIRWDRDGFSFKTSLLSRGAPQPTANVYTKKETQDVIMRVVTDSQQFNFGMMQLMMETMDRQWGSDLRLVTNRLKENRNKN